MQYFEKSYQNWCKALTADYDQEEQKVYQAAMMKVLDESQQEDEAEEML